MKTDVNDLIRRVLDGRKHEYADLVSRYQGPVYNLLYQMLQQSAEAEELAQEVFVKAYDKLHTFNFQSQFFSWIYRIAINTAISHQKKARRYLHPEQMPEQHGPSADGPDRRLEQDEEEEWVRKAVARLSEPHQSVVVLYYFEELSYAKIAEVLEVEEKRVKSRLFDARRKLKEMLGKKV